MYSSINFNPLSSLPSLPPPGLLIHAANSPPQHEPGYLDDPEKVVHQTHWNNTQPESTGVVNQFHKEPFSTVSRNSTVSCLTSPVKLLDHCSTSLTSEPDQKPTLGHTSTTRNPKKTSKRKALFSSRRSVRNRRLARERLRLEQENALEQEQVPVHEQPSSLSTETIYEATSPLIEPASDHGFNTQYKYASSTDFDSSSDSIGFQEESNSFSSFGDSYHLLYPSFVSHPVDSFSVVPPPVPEFYSSHHFETFPHPVFSSDQHFQLNNFDTTLTVSSLSDSLPVPYKRPRINIADIDDDLLVSIDNEDFYDSSYNPLEVPFEATSINPSVFNISDSSSFSSLSSFQRFDTMKKSTSKPDSTGMNAQDGRVTNGQVVLSAPPPHYSNGVLTFADGSTMKGINTSFSYEELPSGDSAASPFLPDNDDEDGADDKKTSAFLLKTFNMVSDSSNSSIVAWNSGGDEFVVKNEHDFASKILPVHFRHKNFSSFVRQLNFYGFSKRSTPNQHSHFKHNFFRRARRDLLPQIKRKMADQAQNVNLKDALATLQTRVDDLQQKYTETWRTQQQILLLLSKALTRDNSDRRLPAQSYNSAGFIQSHNAQNSDDLLDYSSQGGMHGDVNEYVPYSNNNNDTHDNDNDSNEDSNDNDSTSSDISNDEDDSENDNENDNAFVSNNNCGFDVNTDNAFAHFSEMYPEYESNENSFEIASTPYANLDDSLYPILPYDESSTFRVADPHYGIPSNPFLPSSKSSGSSSYPSYPSYLYPSALGSVKNSLSAPTSQSRNKKRKVGGV